MTKLSLSIKLGFQVMKSSLILGKIERKNSLASSFFANFGLQIEPVAKLIVEWKAHEPKS